MENGYLIHHRLSAAVPLPQRGRLIGKRSAFKPSPLGKGDHPQDGG